MADDSEECAEFKQDAHSKRCIAVLLIAVGSFVTGQDVNDTGTSMAVSTSDVELVTFASDDVLSDPWFKMINFTFPNNETIRDGFRRMYPYVIKDKDNYLGQVYYSQIFNYPKLAEVARNPALHDKLFCHLMAWPVYGDYATGCYLGSTPYFRIGIDNSPIEMLRSNPIFSVSNVVFALVALVLGVFGNILIIYSIQTRKELNTTTNMLLAGIAVADIFNSMYTVLIQYSRSFAFARIDHILGQYGCLMVYTFREFLQFAAVNHLVTLSFERYFAICWPMNHQLKFTPKRTVLAILLSWVIAGIEVTPYSILTVGLAGNIHPGFPCRYTGISIFRWPYFAMTMYFLIPVPVICFNYVSILRTLLASIKGARKMTGENGAQTKMVKGRLKVVYMLIALVVLYIISFVPDVSIRLFYEIAQTTFLSGADRQKMLVLISMLRSMNSCTNIIAYAVISRQFRAAFKEILCGCRKKPSCGNSGIGEIMTGTVVK